MIDKLIEGWKGGLVVKTLEKRRERRGEGKVSGETKKRYGRKDRQ